MAGTTDVAQSCTSRCRHCTLYTGQQKQLNLWHHPDPDTCGCMICLSLQGRQLAEVKLQVGQLHAATKAGGRAARRQVNQQQPVTMQVDQVSNSLSQWTRCANWWRMSCERTYPSLGSLAANAVAAWQQQWQQTVYSGNDCDKAGAGLASSGSNNDGGSAGSAEAAQPVAVEVEQPAAAEAEQPPAVGA